MPEPRSDPDRILSAKIAGCCAYHAKGGQPLTPEAEAAAVADLTELAAGRADLLAERAGLALGCHEGAGRYQLVADLCVKAGADESLIPHWVEVGRARAGQASQVPSGGRLHRGGQAGWVSEGSP